MRIGIDIRYLCHGLVGGVHYYVKHLVPALLAAGSEHEFVLYADRKAPLELAALPDHATVRYLPYRNALSSVANDLLLLRRAMAADRLDVAHFPANYGFGPQGVATVITLHDAINIMPLPQIIAGHPKDARTITMMSYLHLMSKAALRQAAGVLTVSQHARREILHYSHLDPERIVATYHAPTPDLRRVNDPAVHADLHTRYGITRPYLLADGLKNPGVLVRAWAQLPEVLRQSYELIFFARRQPLPIVEAAVTAGWARLLLCPPRADLITLFSGAEAFLFPSWIEGFGIPILEAMSCGAPVIASDRGSIPEVAGGAARLADAEDALAFAHHIQAVLSDPGEAKRLQTLGYARAAQFSWAHSAARTLACYEQFRVNPTLTALSNDPAQIV
ncbi:MAG: glycosyltransferase family 4 protein [Oscillochloridaceae bacterium umkhey_bin13]